MSRSGLWLGLVTAMAFGLTVRLVNLTSGTLQLDESYTIILAENSVERIFRLAPTDANPPLASLAYKLWTFLFGGSELSWELLAPLVGTLTIGVLGLMVARLFGVAPGLTSAWLLAASPLHVYYTQQVRSYSLAILFSVIAAWALIEDLAGPRLRNALVFVGSSVLFLNSHYYAFLIVPALFVGAAWSQRGDFAGLRRLASQASILALLALPTAICLYLQYTRYYSFDWIGRPHGAVIVTTLIRLAGGSLVAVGIFLIGITVGPNTRSAGSGRSARWILSSWLVLPTILAFATSALGRPFLHPRYAILWLAPFIALAASGITRLPRGWPRWTTVALLCSLGIPQIIETNAVQAQTGIEEQGYRYLEDQVRPGDVILHLSKNSYVPALFYHRHSLEEFYLAGTRDSNVMRYWMPYTTAIGISDLALYRRVWLYRHPHLPPEIVPQVIGSQAFESLKPDPVYSDSLGTIFLFDLQPVSDVSSG